MVILFLDELLFAYFALTSLCMRTFLDFSIILINFVAEILPGCFVYLHYCFTRFRPMIK